MVIIMLILISTANSAGQQIKFGIFFDPLLGWYSSNSGDVSGEGVRAGFASGLAVNYYFSRNFSFSTGITYMNTGGVQSTTEATILLFTNFTTDLQAGRKAVYSASYLSVPLGIKMRTRQIGYLSIFSDAGIDPGFLTRGTISIPSAGIEKELGSREIKKLNLGAHLQLGAEYSPGGSTVMIFGLGYEHGLSDVTIDNEGQPADKTINRLIRVRLGLFF